MTMIVDPPSNTPPSTMSNVAFDSSGLRSVVRGMYDLQKLRIQTGLRIVANKKRQMGLQTPGHVEKTLDNESKKLLDEMRVVYKRLTDYFVSSKVKLSPKTFKGEGLITSYVEYNLIRSYNFLDEEEGGRS